MMILRYIEPLREIEAAGRSADIPEERVPKDSKLQAVFSKLSGVLPRAEDFQGNTIPKIMSSDIIESVLADTPVPVSTNNWQSDPFCYNSPHQSSPTLPSSPPPPLPPPFITDDTPPINDDVISNVTTLTQRLEQELRSAKRSHLSCGEVLLPCGLLQRVAKDIATMAESEPCGLRGCHLYIIFEPLSCLPTTRIGKIECDPGTACTFELYLTLKQTSNGWNFLPHFLRNLTRGGTVVLSPGYMLSKKKLYRSNIEQLQIEK